MKFISKITAALSLSILILPFFIVSISAQEGNPDEILQTTVSEERTQTKEQIREARCTRITNRIKLITEKYDKNRDKHVEHYRNVKNRLQALVTRLDAKGYDTTELKADLVTLDNKTKEFATLYTDYVNELNDSKEFACGESEGQFATSVKEARAKLKLAGAKAKEIRTFIRTDIIADLKDLKNQKPETN